VLLRIEEVQAAAGSLVEEQATLTGVPAVRPASPAAHDGELPPAADAADGHHAEPAPPIAQRVPRRPDLDEGAAARRRRRRRVIGVVSALALVIVLIGAAGYLALQSVYFIGTNERGLVTLYQGVPYRLPGNIALYKASYVSGVGASTIPPQRRRTLLDHSLRSEGDAASLIRSLETGQLE
jgi:protein phosphatase